MLPYYWNIRPNIDFMAEPVYYAKRGVDFAGELRYLTQRQRGTLDFNYPAERRHRGHRPHARAPRARRRAARRLALPHRRHRRQRQPATSRISRTAPKAPACRSPNGSRKPRIATSTGTCAGRCRTSRPSTRTCPTEDRPYARTPRVLASGDWDLGLGAIDYGFDAEFVNFERNVGVTGWRMDVAPRVGLRLVGAGILRAPLGGLSLHAVLARKTRRRAPTTRPRARCRSHRSMRAWCSNAPPARTASAA